MSNRKILFLFPGQGVQKVGMAKDIYDKYSDLGKKIACDLDNKNSVINVLDGCYNQAKSLVNEFNKIDDSFYYEELTRINSAKQKAINARNKLSSTKKEVTDLYAKIEEIEREVKNKIDELEEVKINSFDYIIA